MLADVQTWGATFWGGRSMRSGHLVGRLPWRFCSMLADVQTLGATFRGGGVLMRSGILSGGCRGRSALMLTDVQTLGATIRGGGALMRSASCRAVAVVVLLDACRRSDVGAQPFGAVGSDALGHLVECVPWWFCSVVLLADVRTWAQPFGAVVL